MRVHKRHILLSIPALAVGLMLGWFVVAYLGLLDSGKFEIVQSQAIAPDRIAMLARRSDHIAMSGDTYFVFIGKHLYSARELRRTLYSSQPVFVVDRNGMVLHWTNAHQLVIDCRDCGITRDRIEKQRFSDGDIAIRYDGFP